MKVSNTSQRLKSIMQKRNLKQVDILNLAKPYCKKYDIKLTKVDLSQYVSGKVEPGQAKLFVLAAALNVSEAWLMGLDVSSKPSVSSDLDAELYSIGRALETLDERVAFYTNFHKILDILGYSLTTNWTIDSFGNTIDLMEDKDFKIEVPHSEIKEIMDSSRSFISYQIKQLFSNYKKKPRNKQFDDMTDEEFEQYFSDDAPIPKDSKIILDQTREQLTSQEGLMFECESASPEAVDSIPADMQAGMEMAKLKNKEKYTPKKYKKEKYTRPDQVVSIVREPEPDYLAPDAAHSREGADAADQEYDDKEIMDNDALWEK